MVEPLETRQLLSAAITLTVNKSAPTDPINFGKVLQNATEPTKTITIKNSGTTEVTGQLDLNNSRNTFEIVSSTGTSSSGDGFVDFDLLAGLSATVKVGMLTALLGTRSGEGAGISYTDSAGPEQFATLNFAGEVDAASAANYASLGTLGSGTITKTGQITATEVEDDEGTVVDQVSDQLYGFQVTSQSTLNLAMSASGTNSSASGGVVATLLPDQSNGTSKQLTIQERNAAIGSLTASISGTTTVSATPTKDVLLPGYYFIYLSSSGVNNTSDNSGNPIPQTINYTLNATIQQAAPAAISVAGSGVAISSGDTSPSTSDGTSFGSVVAGTSEALTFTVKNTGGSALTISGSRPDVSGDFLATAVLPGSIAAGGSATFAVAPADTKAGTKSGVVSISTNVGTFTFDVGGTYTTPLSAAAIAVSGNGVAIAAGNTTPSTSDGTSFGTVTTGTSETLTFTVKDTGGQALALTGTEPVVTGDFVVSSPLPGSIAGGSSATFSVTPIDSAAGTKSGVVSIQSNAGTFTFDIGGSFAASAPNPPTTSQLTAVVTSKKLTKAAASYAFTVVYTDNAGIDLSSLNNHDILVTGAGGFRKWAKLISATPSKGGKIVTAVYHLLPMTGSWTKALNGSYNIYVRGTVLDSNGAAASIFDASGDPNPLTVVGHITVHIAK
jgi:hypothetical protein